MAPKNAISKTDPPWQHLRISVKGLEGLRTQWSILHLLHHRSRNQHRRSSWYRHFNIFRKQLRALIDDIEPELPADALPSRKVRVFQAALQNAEKRIKFWADVLLERWYAAFMQLIGDQQFGVLGITLLAVLAYVVDVLDLLEKMTDVDSKEAVRDGLQEATRRQRDQQDKRVQLLDESHDLGVSVQRDVEAEQNMADIGTAVSRDAIHKTNLQRLGEEGPQEFLDAPGTPPAAKTTKKKRKRKGDEIDDLFSGLLGD